MLVTSTVRLPVVFPVCDVSSRTSRPGQSGEYHAFDRTSPSPSLCTHLYHVALSFRPPTSTGSSPFATTSGGIPAANRSLVTPAGSGTSLLISSVRLSDRAGPPPTFWVDETSRTTFSSVTS